MEIGELPPDMQELVLGEVRKEENLIWAEQPDPNKFMLSGIPSVLIGILLTPSALFLLHGVYPILSCATGFGQCKTTVPIFLFFGLFVGLFGILGGILMFLLGLFFLATPYVKKLCALKTVYVVTNKRAICFNKIGSIRRDNGFKGYEILTYYPDKLIHMKKVVRANGSGDLIFVEIPIRSPGPDPFLSFRKVGFLSIKNVNSVEDLIRKTFLEK
jgi:hypothetical protein